MTAEKDFQALVGFTGKNKVLSLYLETYLARRSKDAIKLLFRQHIRDLDEKPDPADVAAIEKFLNFEYDWQSRGLAIFVSGNDLWKAIPLPIAVTTQAYLTEKPYLRILADIMDHFARYGVALVDKESVRLFSVAWGKIQSETEAFGEELKRHKQGGWAAARYQRREDNLALHNLKQAVEVMQAFCQRADCSRLMLAGSSEVLSQVKELLPKQMRGNIIGEFVADVDTSAQQILERSLDIAAQVELEEERRLVSDVITAVAKGGPGVIGLADTLYVLRQGRVHQLLVAEGFHASGYLCPSCGYVSAALAKCPFCGHGEMSAIPDAVNRAIHKAIQTGAVVNVVRKSEELSKAGSIAAVLRY